MLGALEVAPTNPLAAIGELHHEFIDQAIPHWLFGWPPDAFGQDPRDLGGHRMNVISRRALLADKSAVLGDPAKDVSDIDALKAEDD